MTASSRRLLSLGRRLHALYVHWRGLDSEFLVATAIIATDVLATTIAPSAREAALEDYIAICRGEFANSCVIADRVDAHVLNALDATGSVH